MVPVALLVLAVSVSAAAQQARPEVGYFPLKGTTLTQLERALNDFMLGNVLRFSWRLPERLTVEYDFGYSAPVQEELDKLTRVSVDVDVEVRRCAVPLKLDLPDPAVSAQLPAGERAAWEARVQVLHAAQLQHHQVFRESGLVARACRQIARIGKLDIPLIKRKPFGREIVETYLRDRVSQIVDHYAEPLEGFHERLDTLRAGGKLDRAAEAQFFSALADEAAGYPEFK